MTVTTGSVAPRKARRTSAPAGSGRSGAALRAYERRQQRASAQGGVGDAASHVTPTGAAGASFAARIPFVALIIGLLSLGLCSTLVLTTRSAGDSYDLSDARAHNESLIQERASLQRDVELADSAPELARKAAEQGMVPADNAARLLVHEDGRVEVIGTPAPAQGKPVAPLDPPESQGTSQSSDSAARNPSQQARNEQSTSSSSRPSTATPVPPATSATPNAANSALGDASGEQLVPMEAPSASPSGSRQ